MTKAMIAVGVLATVLVLVVLVVLAASHQTRERYAGPAAPSPAMPPSSGAVEAPEGFLYGRVTTAGGDTYEGRLRWGGDEEALWGHYFNGWKDENPWLSHLPAERLTEERPIGIFGVELARRQRRVDLGRFFMARFGDIARIEARGARVWVTKKSGTVFDLDRHAASDFDDGVRVWDAKHGVVDLGTRQIRTIELLPTARPGDGPHPLHGTVRTGQGEFTGFVQWNREECVGGDELDGRAADGALSLRFDTIRSIARRSRDSSLVTLLDGRQIELSDSPEVGRGNRGIYVDDRRYGRVLVSWDVFERIDFSLASGVPAYGDFPPGGPLTGSVTTRPGRRFAGRLVFDLDESETTETLDAPSHGVDYTIPFGRIASIVAPGREAPAAQGAKVTLHSGEELQLEPTGDLGEGNAGLLIFADGQERPEYVSWSDVERIDIDPPSAARPASHPR